MGYQWPPARISKQNTWNGVSCVHKSFLAVLKTCLCKLMPTDLFEWFSWKFKRQKVFGKRDFIPRIYKPLFVCFTKMRADLRTARIIKYACTFSRILKTKYLPLKFENERNWFFRSFTKFWAGILYFGNRVQILCRTKSKFLRRSRLPKAVSTVSTSG